MKIHMQNFTAFVSLAFALALTACGNPASPTPQATLQPVTLKVGTSEYMTFAPFYIAESAGLFAEQGLKIEFVQFTVTREATAALEQGQLDVLGGNASPSFLNTIGRGAKMKLVADKGYIASSGCTDSAILVRKALMESKAFDDPAKIRGMKASMNTVDLSGFFIEKALSKQGLTLNDIQGGPTQLPEAVVTEGFAKGTLDITWSDEPMTTRVLESGNAAVWITGQALVPDYPRASVIYGPNLLEKNIDAGKRFMVAYLKAVRQYNEGKTDRNIELIAKVTKLDKEFLKRVCWPAIRPDGQTKTAQLFDFQAWAVKQKLIDNPVPDEKTLWDPSFIEYANKMIGAAR